MGQRDSSLQPLLEVELCPLLPVHSGLHRGYQERLAADKVSLLHRLLLGHKTHAAKSPVIQTGANTPKVKELRGCPSKMPALLAFSWEGTLVSAPLTPRGQTLMLRPACGLILAHACITASFLSPHLASGPDGRWQGSHLAVKMICLESICDFYDSWYSYRCPKPVTTCFLNAPRLHEGLRVWV